MSRLHDTPFFALGDVTFRIMLLFFGNVYDLSSDNVSQLFAVLPVTYLISGIAVPFVKSVTSKLYFFASVVLSS